jgi:hypothetical protein
MKAALDNKIYELVIQGWSSSFICVLPVSNIASFDQVERLDSLSLNLHLRVAILKLA